MLKRLGAFAVAALVLGGCWGLPTAPSPVTGLQGSATVSTVSLSWTNPPDFWGVRVYRAEGSTPPAGPGFGQGPGNYLADVGDRTSFTDTGLSPGTTYSYSVIVYGADGYYSTPATITIATVTATGNAVLGTVARPATLVEPNTVTPLAPLVILLHGYSSTAAAANSYLGITAQAASRGLYVLLPDGTIDQYGYRGWNAGTIAANPSVDDVGYLRDLIVQAIAVRPIDPDRVYVFGHSNGGAMGYRLACEIPGQVAAIAALAGPQVTGLTCVPSQPVSVLSIHGNADEIVFYNGGSAFGNYGTFVFPLPSSPYLGAVEQLAQWGARNGCSSQTALGARIDLVTALAGAETAVIAHQGCPQGIDVQLDTIEGGTHIPSLIQTRVGTDVLDWLLTHTR